MLSGTLPGFKLTLTQIKSGKIKNRHVITKSTNSSTNVTAGDFSMLYIIQSITKTREIHVTQYLGGIVDDP